VKTGTPPSSLVVSLLSLSVVLMLGIASCTRTERTLGESLTNDRGTGLVPSGDAAPPQAPDASMFRELCKTSSCPAPYITCSSDTFQCETNSDSDNDNCGACGVECPRGDEIRDFIGAEWSCQSGQCRMTCDPRSLRADCNSNPSDGCETDLGCDENNCGACGVKCPPGLTCREGNCGCPGGMTDCGGETCRIADACVSLVADDNNCGACGVSCPTEPIPPYPNTRLGCMHSECGKVKCEFGFDDCNQNIELDGCESDIFSDAQNCGMCNKKCAPGQFCFAGKCKCAPNESACPMGEDFVQCFDLDNDPYNCGACGLTCPMAANGMGREACRLGHCTLDCPSGFADCDGRADNGCETMISADPRNCGGCNVQCDLAIGQPCVNGACALEPCESGGTQ